MSELIESNKSIRTIIYGAGAVGGVVGGHLALAGKEVILIGRPGHVDAIREHGLRFVTPTDTHTLRLPAITEPSQVDFRPEDVVFLCVKGQNTDEALRDLRTVVGVGDIPIFCVQNGIPEKIAIRHFPRVYGVSLGVGGLFANNGEVLALSDPPGWLIMGRYPAGTDDLVDAVATNLRDAGFYVVVTSDVMPCKWGKLIFQSTMVISAITDMRAREGDNNDRILRAVQQEAREIVSKAGIRWISVEEQALQWPETYDAQPRSRLDTKAKGSTWQSLARQQGTVETDFLNGEIVRLAERLGTQAPINERLLRVVQQMATNRELPGKYTSAELCRLVGLD